MPHQLRAVFCKEEEGRARQRGQRQSVRVRLWRETTEGSETHETEASLPSHGNGWGVSHPHFSISSPFQENKQKLNTIFHEFPTANNTTSSFCKIQSLSFSQECQLFVRSVHAAALSLLNRLCKSFCNCLVLEQEHFKQKIPEESHALPLSKALAWFKNNLLGIITEYPESLLSKDLFTPLKSECQIAMCSTNILLTFCSF